MGEDSKGDDQGQRKVRVVVIIGSVRVGSNTGKVAQLVAKELEKLPSMDVDLIDPRQFPLRPPGMENDPKVLSELQRRIRSSDGAVLVTPEYDGSYSSVIKLMIEHMGYPSALSGKPVGMIGVASGKIGAVKALEHLRSVCGHIGALVLPWAKSVADVDKIFDEMGCCQDPATQKSVESVSRELVAFIRHGG